MRFAKLLNRFRNRCTRQGRFDLHPAQEIRNAVRLGKVPKEPGVYVVTAVAGTMPVVYIGKAGTLMNDGTWKDQMLSGRLCNRQSKAESRQQFWQRIIAEIGASHLSFEWFVTAGPPLRLPALAEAQLLQAFFDDNGRLPAYNECA